MTNNKWHLNRSNINKFSRHLTTDDHKWIRFHDTNVNSQKRTPHKSKEQIETTVGQYASRRINGSTSRAKTQLGRQHSAVLMRFLEDTTKRHCLSARIRNAALCFLFCRDTRSHIYPVFLVCTQIHMSLVRTRVSVVFVRLYVLYINRFVYFYWSVWTRV